MTRQATPIYPPIHHWNVMDKISIATHHRSTCLMEWLESIHKNRGFFWGVWQGLMCIAVLFLLVLFLPFLLWYKKYVRPAEQEERQIRQIRAAQFRAVQFISRRSKSNAQRVNWLREGF